jgi:hypothetical protein
MTVLLRRRGLLLAAPALVLAPGVLMPVRTDLVPFAFWLEVGGGPPLTGGVLRVGDAIYPMRVDQDASQPGFSRVSAPAGIRAKLGDDFMATAFRGRGDFGGAVGGIVERPRSRTAGRPWPGPPA